MQMNSTDESRTVPYLTAEDFERRAKVVLEYHGRRYGTVEKPPIPIDEIVELSGGLHMNFKDLQAEAGGGAVLGCTDVQSRSVYLDESLDPDEYPEKEVRLRFTMAHELGHWLLHREHGITFNHMGDAHAASEDRNVRMQERQAHRFAACLLMPRDMILDLWRAEYGSWNPEVFDNHPWLNARIELPGPSVSEVSLEEVVDYEVGKFARNFRVSREAMRIRLEGLGLLPHTKSSKAKP